MFYTVITRTGSNISIPSIFDEHIRKDILIDTDGKAVTPNMQRALAVLSTNAELSFCIMDPYSASLFPEILTRQTCVVCFKHETAFEKELSRYNWFNEIFTVTHGAKFDYFDADFKDASNDGLLSVIDTDKFKATNTWYQEQIEHYTERNRKYPSILLDKTIQKQCGGRYFELKNAIAGIKTLSYSDSTFPTISQLLDIEVGNLLKSMIGDTTSHTYSKQVSL